MIVAVNWFSWDRAEEVVESVVGNRLGMDVEIGDLNGDIALVPRITARDVVVRQLQQSEWPVATIPLVEFGIELLPMLIGRFELHDVIVRSAEVRLTAGDGARSWDALVRDLSERLRKLNAEVDSFEISGFTGRILDQKGRLQLRMNADLLQGAMPTLADLRGLARTVTFAAGDTGGPAPVELSRITLQHKEGRLPVRMHITGRIHDQALDLQVAGENLARGEPGQRDAVVLRGDLGESTLRIDGTASRAGDPHLEATVELDARGRSRWLPVELEGRITDRGDGWTFDELTVHSEWLDMQGRLQLENRDARPRLTGRLRGSRLRLPVADSKEIKDSEDPNGSDGNDLQSVRELLRTVDAALQLEFRDAGLYGIRLRNLSTKLELNDGRLALQPITGDTQGGSASARLIVDASSAPLTVQTAGSFQGVDVHGLLEQLGVERNIFGELEGGFDVATEGTSIDSLWGHLEGDVAVIMANGRIDSSLVEMASMDFAGAILSALHGEGTKKLRCAVADFKADDGVLEARTLVLDTGETKLIGRGTIDLADMTADLVIRSHSEDFSLLAAEAPIHIQGKLTSLKTSTEAGKAAASLLTPIELGEPVSNHCQQLFQEAERALARPGPQPAGKETAPPR
ncbi:hypothetical protein BH24PSE2_BH24PSE2_14660 [soil metagenome]